MTDTTSTSTILLVEDDARLAALVQEYLQDQGLTVTVEPRGDTAVARILGDAPDVVVLDIMLPGLDGLSVCRQVRPLYRGGIIMLTARGDEVDEVVGLELGADDYLAKPVRPRVLLARLKALLRRLEAAGADSPPHARSRVVLGVLEIDASARTTRLAGELVRLTTAEFDLLWLLATRAGQVVDRDTLYEELTGVAYDGLDRSIDLRVARVRKKLGDDATDPRFLKSVRGVGYLLAVPPAPAPGAAG